MDFLTWGIKVSLIFFLNKSLKEITVFFWIDIAWGLQKLGLILENISKFKVSKTCDR